MTVWLRIVFLIAVSSLPVWARARYQGWCEQGNQTISVLGYVSSSATPVQRSYSSCTVTVYITGSGGTLAALYSNNSGTGMSNPFTANSSGFYFFYADDGDYDVQISSAGIVSPFTLGASPMIDPFFDPPSAWAGAIATRTKNAKIADMLSVLDFGAVGDGTHDDTNAITVGVVSALAARKTLYFPCGTYLHTTLTFSNLSNVHLVGEGKDCTILQHSAKDPAANGVVVKSLGAGESVVSNWRIENLSLYGDGWYDSTPDVLDLPGDDGIGLLVIGVANSVFRDLRVRYYGSHGIGIATSWVNTWDSIESWNNGGDCVRLDSALDPRAPVFGDQNVNNWFRPSFVGCYGAGYHSIDSQTNTIYGGTIESNRAQAVLIERPFAESILGAFMENNGIVTPSHTIVATSTDSGLGFALTLIGNKISGNRLAGYDCVNIQGVQNSVIEGNYFQHCPRSVVNLAADANFTHIGTNFISGDSGGYSDSGSGSTQFYADALGTHLTTSASPFVVTSPNALNLVAPSITANANAVFNSDGTLFITAPANVGLKVTSDGAYSAAAVFDTTASGQASYVGFFDRGVSKFTAGKDATNNFFVYDATNLRDILQGSAAGNLALTPSGGYTLVGTATPFSTDAVQVNGVVNAYSGYKVNTAVGMSTTVTIGGCTLTFVGGILTNKAGC